MTFPDTYAIKPAKAREKDNNHVTLALTMP